MTELTYTRELNAPKEQVWKVIADLGNVVAYHPFVLESYYASESDKGVGASRICVFKEMSVQETASEWIEGSHYTLNVEIVDGMKPPLTNLKGLLRVEDTGAGTLITMVVNYEPNFGPLGILVDRMMLRPQYEKMSNGILLGLEHHLKTGETVDITTLKLISLQPAMA